MRLLRHHIKDVLYKYYARETTPVGELERPIDFKSIINFNDYTRKVAKAYKELGRSWLTPVELFRPYFAQGVANVISRNHEGGDEINVIEIGGGTGSLADDCLSKISSNHSPTWTNIDISPELAKRQSSRCRHHGEMHSAHVGDATDEGVLASAASGRTSAFIVAVEVLDNLAHDKVVRDAKGNLNEVWVSDGGTEEHRRPLSDPLVVDCVRQGSVPGKTYFGQERKRYVPTKSKELLKRVGEFGFAHVDLLFIDFASLPEVQIQGEFAPIVAKHKPFGEAADMDTYLLGDDAADVLFPTDFDLLQRMAVEEVGGKAQSMPLRRMAEEEFGEEVAKQTQLGDGTQVLLHDYTNMRALHLRKRSA